MNGIKQGTNSVNKAYLGTNLTKIYASCRWSYLCKGWFQGDIRYS